MVIMIWLVNQIRKLKKVLNSKQSPEELALAVSIGFICALLPKGLLFYLFFASLFVFSVNLFLSFLVILLVSALAPFYDIYLDKLGYFLLRDVTFLNKFWSFLYKLPIIPYTNFNNSIVIAATVLGLFAFFPLFYFSRFLIISYRRKRVGREN